MTNQQSLRKNLIISPSSWKNPEHHLEILLTDPWYKVISHLLNELILGTVEFYKLRNIKPYLFPLSTGSVSSPIGVGSDSKPVQVILKNQSVFLSDSMQFSLEIGARLSEIGAYHIMPCFRGEELDNRHLNEFLHIETEILGELEDVKIHVKEYIYFLLQHIKKTIPEDILSIAGSLKHIDSILENPDKHFISIRYEDAIKQLNNIEGSLSSCVTGYSNITPFGEKYLISQYGEFVWLTHMPWQNVPFYQASEKGTVYSHTADLLAGIGEVVGSGQRVYSEDDLLESLSMHKVGLNGYEWYLNMRRIKPLQTSGFGLGVERLMLWLIQKEDIRDCMLLIRDHQKINLP
jgi:asparaginyl-tRNA synthetase